MVISFVLTKGEGAASHLLKLYATAIYMNEVKRRIRCRDQRA